MTEEERERTLVNRTENLESQPRGSTEEERAKFREFVRLVATEDFGQMSWSFFVNYLKYGAQVTNGIKLQKSLHLLRQVAQSTNRGASEEGQMSRKERLAA